MHGVSEEVLLSSWFSSMTIRLHYHHPGYGDFRGEDRFRAALANMMQATFVQAPVDKDALMVQAGCGAILDSLAWCLGEEGQSCICPAPLYPAFVNDFYARARVHLHMAQTFHPEYALTEEILEQAFDECQAAGKPAKMLLLCNPCNPLGLIYDQQTIQMCLKWVEKKGIHLISDEIYANSIFPGESFKSVAKVAQEMYPERGDMYLGKHIHMTYGFSKDWAMSGIRAGVLMSHNKELIAAASNLSCFMAMSSYVQVSIRLGRPSSSSSVAPLFLTVSDAAVVVDRDPRRFRLCCRIHQD